MLLLGPGLVRAELNVSGLPDELEANVRALSPLTASSCDSARWRIERLFRDVEQNMRQSLQAFGYYQPSISKSLHWDNDCWRVDVSIEPGEPVRFRRVDVAISGPAAQDRDFNARIAAGSPQSGEILHHGKYAAFKDSLERAAIYAGYFDAEFAVAKVEVDPAAHRADLEMRFASGPKYRFGAVSFTPGIIRDELMGAYTDIRPGDPYSSKAINELYEALSGSNFFGSVSIVTDPVDTATRTVPVEVKLTPAKRRIFSAGGGFTTDLGPHVRLGYANRRINDRGHQFDSRLYLSPVDSEVNASYRWPRKDPRSDWFSVFGGIQHVDTDTNDHDTFTLGILRSKNIGRSWLQTRYLNFERENFVVGDQDTTSQLIIIGSNWEKAEGRALSRASNGYRMNFDVRGASDSLGSDTSFLQLRTKLRWIHSFSEKTRILARASLGFTAKDDLQELPASVRFFSGGDRSVRGYEFESLGPVDSDGNVTGGSHQVDMSLELDRRVRNRWSLAAFIDSGSAFNSSDIDLSTGIGLGLRWYSPVGPIRLDFAHPLDDPDRSLRIHISLGPDL